MPAPDLKLSIERVTQITTPDASESIGELRGYLQICRQEPLLIRDISIYFEGVSRNWISPNPSVQLYVPIFKAERKFLSQAQNIPPIDLIPNHTKDHSVYQVPFHFIIPAILPNVDPALPRYCSQLPPSFEIGQVIIDKRTGSRFAQPSIQYFLRAVVGFTSGEAPVQPRRAVEAEAPVAISPYTSEYPPTDIRDFPAEFKEAESQTLKRHIFSNALGVMRISTQEPPAMGLSDGCTSGSTSAFLKLEFQSRNSSEIQDLLGSLTFTILSLIRVKTFYSLKPFPRLPSLSLLEMENTTRLRDELIKLETRTEQGLSWDYIYDLMSQSQDGLEAQSALAANKPLCGKWVTTMDLPIEVDHHLLPTFCTSVVARLYSVIIRVKIAGARSGAFDLEVPLQVIDSPSSMTKVQKFRERDLEKSEDLRRESEAEFERNELSYQKDPPHYYP